MNTYLMNVLTVFLTDCITGPGIQLYIVDVYKLNN